MSKMIASMLGAAGAIYLAAAFALWDAGWAWGLADWTISDRAALLLSWLLLSITHNLLRCWGEII